MEDFKRPNHPDFMLSSELKAIEFSGIRHNSLTYEMELWLRGEVKMRIAVSEYNTEHGQQLWNKTYSDIFGLYNVETINERN
jgi:hypothetical protein